MEDHRTLGSDYEIWFHERTSGLHLLMNTLISLRRCSMRRRGPPGRRCRSQPGRGGMADPEAYDFTSIQERIRSAVTDDTTLQPVTFLPFVGSPRQDMQRTELNHSRRFTIRPSLRDGFDLTKAKPSVHLNSVHSKRQGLFIPCHSLWVVSQRWGSYLSYCRCSGPRKGSWCLASVIFCNSQLSYCR